MSEYDYPEFRPVLGTEEKILNSTPLPGYLYFATDTKKIFYGDLEERSFIPMGGNLGLYYGKMQHAEVPDKGQEDFEFSYDDLEEIDKVSSKIAIGDLILNLPDGSFYRVVGFEDDDLINTKRITISGSGGDGQLGNAIGTMTFDRLGNQYLSAVYNGSCKIGFKASAVDGNGDPTGDGSIKVYIAGAEETALRRKISQNKDIWLEIGQYLPIGSEIKVTVELAMDTGGSSPVTRKMHWFVTVSESKLTWEPNELIPHDLTTDFILSWNISGEGLEKIINITIDDYIPLTSEPITGTLENWEYVISKENFSSYGLGHGSHKIKIEASVMIEGTQTPLGYIEKYLMFKDPTNESPIISCLLVDRHCKQYNTVIIPVVVNSPQVGGTIYIMDDEREVGKEENVQNNTLYEFSYTPSSFGDVLLNISYNGVILSITLDVEDLGLGNLEVTDYAFKFKANSFANNYALKNWVGGQQNGIDIKPEFSANFDWRNGGLLSERDENNNIRNFIRVKAGSTMTLDYKLFLKDASLTGKLFKIIFKAVNCRDYDAQVLSCKKDKKEIYVNKVEGEEFILDIEDGTSIQYSQYVKIDDTNTFLELVDAQSDIFDTSDEDSRKTFSNKYIIYEDKIYLCTFKKIDDVSYYGEFNEVKIIDSFSGLLLQAQNVTFKSRNSSITSQYCENSYIELELEIINDGNKKYIKFWMDGIPSNFVIHSSDDFTDAEAQKIVIGSSECDVDIYLIKCYERNLTDNEHINNFIIDADSAEEIISRYRRNNILNASKEIDPYLLAQANQDCLVNMYEIKRMPIKKSDEVYPCQYQQLKGSNEALYSAKNVMIKVQGTSSEEYVVAAANLDTDFLYRENGNQPSGILPTGQSIPIEGWSISNTSIPINFTCTKVNVASCENANNVLNQEWYNLFQPYKSILRCKSESREDGKVYRDTMEFANGVLFIKDLNQTYGTAPTDNKKLNNVFGEIQNYISNPYYKFYSIANMGNSKDNIEVFHDITNPKECCVEVKDNQTTQQQMIKYYDDIADENDIGKSKKIFDFRYVDKSNKQEMIGYWNRFFKWMVESNPQPKYKKFEDITDEIKYRKIAYNPKTKQWLNTYILNADGTEYNLQEYSSDYTTYYLETNNAEGYTNLPLANDVKKDYGDYTFRGYKAGEKAEWPCPAAIKNEETGEKWQDGYTPLIAGYVEKKYNYNNYIERDASGNIISNGIADENGYTHDCYEYRMAKMLHECEDYLVMDSVVFHYLFIERHCMIDNVAKNTFWSTEDGGHWNLIKDYDNDTANGIDNTGKFTRQYGMEPKDKLNENTYVFNAQGSTWLNFIIGLEGTCTHMYNRISGLEKIYKGQTVKCFQADGYLKAFKDWQKIIPERCWIEDYYRKYFRPYEIYNDTMFLGMMEGGKKTHQRAQFETYQDIYIGSKYDGGTTDTDNLWFRPTGAGLSSHTLPVKVYSDCYVRVDVGQQVEVQRAKRNTTIYLHCPVDGDIGQATMEMRPAALFTVIGDKEGGQVNDYVPTEANFSKGGKLRELYFCTADSEVYNEVLTSNFSVNSPILEKLYVANLTYFDGDLNLSECSSLLEVDTTNSTFNSITLPDNSPLQTVKLQEPSSLQMSNLYNLKELTINSYSELSTLDLNNIDNTIPTVSNPYPPNSKNIVENVLKLNNQEKLKYRLKNVNWTFNNSEDITYNSLTNKAVGIKLLDTLLSPDKCSTFSSNDYESGREPTSIALTGRAEVSSDAYNGFESIDIYDNYSNPNKFPNLNINFEGDNAKLYTITILNGNGDILWERKLQAGDKIDSDFLAGGPYGEFNIDNVRKAQTVQYQYKFKEQWEVKSWDADGEEKTNILEQKIPLMDIVSSDLIFTPLFETETATYTVNFFNYDNSILNSPKGTTIEYGTRLDELYPFTVPYKPNEGLQLYETHQFKGYGRQGSTVPLANDYIIKDNVDLYAIFSEPSSPASVHNAVINSSYLKAYDYEDGCLLSIKNGYVLGGKITLPKTFNGKKVLGIYNDGFKNQDYITHIFWETNSEIKILQQYSFYNCIKLNYYEITDTLETIGTSAFQGCNLNGDVMISLGTPSLKSLGTACFQGSFSQYVNNNESYELYLSGNLSYIGASAFGRNHKQGLMTASIYIGNSENPWVDNIDDVELGSDIFAETEFFGSTYNFYITSQTLSSTAWKNNNGSKFQAKLGLISHVNIV